VRPRGESLQCYYATQEQCEFTVDYHGFCVANPYALPQTYSLRQRRGQSNKSIGAEKRILFSEDLAAARRANPRGISIIALFESDC
jgi:hypothetical protein